MTGVDAEPQNGSSSSMRRNLVGVARCGFILGCLIFYGIQGTAQNYLPEAPQPKKDNPIHVNWFFGSYVPKGATLEPLSSDERLELYVRRTFTARGIYLKTTLFALRDEMEKANPEWGEGSGGFAKRVGTRQAEFILQNSVVSFGDGLLGWEARYDRCRCTGFWPRTRHALVRNFLTYDGSEKKLRPDVLPYLGAFAGNAIATTWEPGKTEWRIKGYQAAITQVPVGMAVNWVGETAPEMARVLRGHKIHER